MSEEVEHGKENWEGRRAGEIVVCQQLRGVNLGSWNSEMKYVVLPVRSVSELATRHDGINEISKVLTLCTGNF
jgi:hypothetical protein